MLGVDGKYAPGSITYRAGGKNLVPATLNLPKPGEWFTLEVIAKGKHLETKVNGKTTQLVNGVDDPKTGGGIAIGLYGDNKTVQIRNIEIQELPVSAPQPPTINALEFDGKASHVAVPSLRLETDKPLTFEAWGKFDKGDGPTETIASTYSAKSALLLCRFMGKSAVFLARRDLQSKMAGLEGTFADDGWVHLAGVWDGKEARVFVNGKLEPSTTTRPVAAQMAELQSQHVYLGAEKVAPGQPLGGFFKGILGEVRFSSAARYVKDFTPERRFTPDKDTVALYRFDEGEGDKLTDHSGHSHHGKIVGAKWVKTEVAVAPPAGAVPAAALAPFDAKKAKEHQDSWGQPSRRRTGDWQLHRHETASDSDGQVRHGLAGQ